MAGEHLPISQYDELTEEEIVHKLGILVQTGSPDLEAVREHEESGQNRSAVIDALKKLEENADELRERRRQEDAEIEPEPTDPSPAVEPPITPTAAHSTEPPKPSSGTATTSTTTEKN